MPHRNIYRGVDTTHEILISGPNNEEIRVAGGLAHAHPPPVSPTPAPTHTLLDKLYGKMTAQYLFIEKESPPCKISLI